jgi:hypothetical protein
MADIVAERLVAALQQSNFVIMLKPPGVGAGPLGLGFKG